MNRQLTQEQQIVQMAMFADPKLIPVFPTDPEVEHVGVKIKQLFDEKKLTSISCTKDGVIVK